MNELYKTYDAIVAPASLKGAPKATDAEDKLSNEYLIAESYMCLGNFSGYPSMTVPFAMVDGLPVGLNMTCRAFEEQTMFTIGQAIEAISGWCDKTVEVK